MTDMAHAKDQVSIADGQITLYRRDDVRDALWQCRIKMKGHRGYIRRSTGQKELEKAEQAAWQILGELTKRIAYGEGLVKDIKRKDSLKMKLVDQNI